MSPAFKKTKKESSPEVKQQSGSLTKIFLQHAKIDVEPQSALTLEAKLKNAFFQAQAAWPGVRVSQVDFIAFLAQRLSRECDLDTFWRVFHCDELYLVCACCQGDEGAIRLLEEKYFKRVEKAVSHLDARPEFVEEAKQALRQHLLVGTETIQPKILEYHGRGDFGRWLRVVAVRVALDRLSPGREDVAGQEEFWETLVAPGENLEMAYIKKHYRKQFRDSLCRAVELLTASECYLLKLHFVEKLSIDEIARIHRVHRATSARWLVKARRSLMAKVKKYFLSTLRVSPAQAQSIMRLIHSNLEVSLPGILQNRED